MPTPEENPQVDSSPAPALPATTEVPAAPARRALPEFGEYAPEGWEWKPEAPVDDSTHAAGQGSTPTSAATPGTVPGVPHNLGAGSTLPKKNARAAASQQTGGAPYVGATPPHPNAQNAATPAAPGMSGASGARAKRSNTADRIITTLLLTLGALGSLQTAFAMFGMGTTFALIGDAPGITPFTGPDWLGPVGKVTGVAILAIYALSLVYAVRRLRAGKLSFWVPLVCALIVFLAMFIIIAAAMINTPELMKVLSDPAEYSKLLDFIKSQQLTKTG